MFPDFSETQFAFFHAFELLNSPSVVKFKKVPFFPSTRKEKDLGYDLSIGFNGRVVFFQYKVPELIGQREPENQLIYDYYGGKYYRFWLTTPNSGWPICCLNKNKIDQHNLLVRLLQLYPGKVFYVAPKIIKNFELMNWYQQKKVRKNSFMSIPKKEYYYGTHQITFNENGMDGNEWSERSEVRSVTWDDMMDETRNEFIDEKYIKNIINSILHILKEKKISHDYLGGQNDDISLITGLLRLYFGVEWFIIDGNERT